MTQEEIRKIKFDLGKKYNKMTPEERTAHAHKITQNFMNYMGRENFFPTDKPNVWIHKPKKKG